MEAVRQPQYRQDPGTAHADQAADGPREELRDRIRLPFTGRDREAGADPAHRRSRGWRVDPRGRQGQSDRPDAVARKGRAHARRHHRRGRQGDRRHGRRRPRHRPHMEIGRRRGRARLRNRRQLRWPVGARAGAAGRCHGAAVRGRAFLPRHQGDSRGRAGHAGDPRSRRLSLLQGGSRRAGDGRLRAQGEALERRPDPGRLRVPAAARGLGSLRDPHAQRHPPHALPRDRGGQAAAERARELHPRRQLHTRRGARARRLLRLRRIQLGRHRECRRRRQARRRVDRPGRRAARPVGRRHAALRAVPRQSQAPRRPHGGDARPPLCDALAARGARDRPPAAPLAALRPAGGEGRRVRQQDELGAGELLPAARRGEAAVHAGDTRLAAARARRAARLPRGRRSSSTRRRSRNSC